MGFPSIHRVVTGHNAEGRAVVTSAGPLPTVVEIAAIPGTVFHEVWSTLQSPAVVDNGPDPTLGPLVLPPPQGCLLYTSPSPRDLSTSRMPSSA